MELKPLFNEQVEWLYREHVPVGMPIILNGREGEGKTTIAIQMGNEILLLNPNGIMIFHDTNMGNGIYARRDGSIGFSWKNNRGVMRAIEDYMDRRYDENSFFCDLLNGKSIIHFPNCNGLTIIKKLTDDFKQ